MRALFVGVGNDGHAGDRLVLRGADGERVNIDGEASRERRDTVEDAGFIFDIGDECLHGFLFLLRFRCRFDERARTANHVAQGRARSNHGINGIFLLHAEVDEHRFG